MTSCWLFIVSLCLCLVAPAAAADTENWETHIKLGQEAREAQHLSEAEKHFKAAIAETQTVPSDELHLAESQDGLAGVYRDQKKYTKSEALYRQSLEIRQRILGPMNSGVTQVLDNLAGVLDSRGKHDQAAPLYKRARQIREQAVAEHPDVYVDSVPKPVQKPK